MQVTIDSSKITNIDQFHDYLKELMEFPVYYGGNLDALWDCLIGWVELPMEVVWSNFEYSRQQLGDYANKILEIFKEAEKELGEDFKITLS